jgi:hypothetical protein
MKTSVEISDSLLVEVRKLAAARRTTVRALIEQGLRQVVAEGKIRRRFALRRASFKGQGLDQDIEGGTWERIRERVYEGHGG